MLDPLHLRTLTTVLQTGSFVVAARQLGYTPSAVCQQMAALERAVRLQPFERGARGVRPTPAAAFLAARGQAVPRRRPAGAAGGTPAGPRAGSPRGQVVRRTSAVPAARRAVSVGGSGLPGAAGLDPHRLARHRRGANTEALFRGVLRRARADRSARRAE